MSKVAVVYWSSTGNTEAMADAVVNGAKEKGADVTLYECADFRPELVGEYDAIAFGCPAMGDEVLEEDEFEPMFDGCKDALKDKFVFQCIFAAVEHWFELIFFQHFISHSRASECDGIVFSYQFRTEIRTFIQCYVCAFFFCAIHYCICHCFCITCTAPINNCYFTHLYIPPDIYGIPPFLWLSSYGQLQNAPAIFPQPGIDLSAFFVSAECFLCFFCITIGFPATGTLTVFPGITDKSYHINQRIIEKQTNLMREFFTHM